MNDRARIQAALDAAYAVAVTPSEVAYGSKYATDKKVHRQTMRRLLVALIEAEPSAIRVEQLKRRLRAVDRAIGAVS